MSVVESITKNNFVGGVRTTIICPNATHLANTYFILNNFTHFLKPFHHSWQSLKTQERLPVNYFHDGENTGNSH